MLKLPTSVVYKIGLKFRYIKQNIWFAIFAGLLTNAASAVVSARIAIVESYQYYHFTSKTNPFRLDNFIFRFFKFEITNRKALKHKCLLYFADCWADVAARIASQPSKLDVVGSNPTRPAKKLVHVQVLRSGLFAYTDCYNLFIQALV